MNPMRSVTGRMPALLARLSLLAALLALTVLPLPAAVEAAPANADEVLLLERILATQAGYFGMDAREVRSTFFSQVSRVPGTICITLHDRDGAGYDAAYCYRRGPAGWALSSERVTIDVFP